MIRKIFNNNYFAFFLVVPFTVWVLSSLFSPVFVSAAESSIYITQGFTNINAFSSYEQQFLETHVFPYNSFQVISNRSGVNGGILSFDLSSMHNWGVVTSENQSYYLYVNRSSRSSSVDYMPAYMDYHGDALSLESQTFFVALPVGTFDFAYLHNFSSDFLNGSNGFLDQYSDSDIVFWGVANGNYDCRVKSFNTKFLNFTVPNTSTALSLGIDKVGFYNWLVQTSKDSNFVSYFSLSSLSQYISYYDVWGSSPQKFLMLYNIDFGDSVGSHLNNIQIIELKNLTDQLYREYLNSLKYPPADFPARDRVDIRKDIDTNTTDNNTVLITDDSNDTVIVSILRDILRGVIALRNQFYVTGTDIITGLNNLDFTVNVANDGGSGFNASDIWGSGSITESENYLALTAAFMDKGIDVSAAENMQINYLDNASQQDSFTVSVVMPDQFVNGQFTEKTVTHTIDNTSKMYNTLILFRKLIAFAVVSYFAIRIRFELPHLIRGE